MTRTRARTPSAVQLPDHPDAADPQLPWDRRANDPRNADAPIPAETAAALADLAPWIVEIGTGNGLWIAREAALRPDAHFLGIERAPEFFHKMKARVLRVGLANVRCLLAEAQPVLARALPPASAAEVVLNFSDPWPKRRHARRRVYRAELFPLLQRVLRPGGTVTFRTDVGWYFNLAAELTRTQPGWRIVAAGPEPAPDFRDADAPAFPDPESAPNPISGAPHSHDRVITNFERKGREAGRSIWAFTARWSGDPESSN